MSVELQGARVVVTGAGGFMGSRLMERLRAEGAHAIGADRSFQDAGDHVQIDVTDPFSVRKALGPDSPADAVVHTAALVGDQFAAADYERVNVTGVEHVAKAAREAGVRRFVQLSSIAGMGFDPGHQVDESLSCERFGDPYGDSKLMGERVALAHHGKQGMEVVAIRPGDVWGPGSQPWVVRPVAMMRSGEFMWVGGGKGRLAMVHIDDILDGLVLALTTPGVGGRSFILTDGTDGCSCREYFGALATAAGIDLKARSMPRALALGFATAVAAAARATGRPPSFTPSAVRYVSRKACSFSIDRARAELGYSPKLDLETGMKELSEWFASLPS